MQKRRLETHIYRAGARCAWVHRQVYCLFEVEGKSASMRM